jgi:multiple sugar transport system substrate-binding protein
MMKSAIRYLGASCLIAAFSLLPSCSRDEATDESEAKGITIWWAQWAPADGLQELGEEFEKETGIAVHVHQISWSSFQDQVFLNFANNQTDFDIVVGDSQWIGRGATEGLYEELTDWLPTAVDMKTLHPRAKQYLCEYPAGSGRYFAAPCETDAVGFAYRKDWFEDPNEKMAFVARYGRDLAPPETWEEFREVAEFFTRPSEKKHGCALLTGRGYDSLTMGFQQFLWSFGGSWGDEKTFQVQGHLNGPEAVAALTFMKSLLRYAPKGAENLNYSKTKEAIENGSTAMAMDYFAFFPDLSAKMGEKVGFFRLPSKDGRRAVSLGGQGFSVSAKTTPAKQELAKQFIAWFLTRDVQEKWITKPAGFTAHTEVLASSAFRDATPYNGPLADSLDDMKDFWSVPVYNKLLASAQKCVGQALDGASEPKEALDRLADEHEKEFRRAGLLK